MSESNELMSAGAQLIGMPLAGPESFSAEQLAYLKRALGVDETVLYENGSTGSATLSETATNFEKLEVWVYSGAFNAVRYLVSIPTGKSGTANFIGGTNGGLYHFYACTVSVNGTTVSTANGCHRWFAVSSSTGVGTEATTLNIDKVIGVHRIAGGN